MSAHHYSITDYYHPIPYTIPYPIPHPDVIPHHSITDLIPFQTPIQIPFRIPSHPIPFSSYDRSHPNAYASTLYAIPGITKYTGITSHPIPGIMPYPISVPIPSHSSAHLNGSHDGRIYILLVHARHAQHVRGLRVHGLPLRKNFVRSPRLLDGVVPVPWEGGGGNETRLEL